MKKCPVINQRRCLGNQCTARQVLTKDDALTIFVQRWFARGTNTKTAVGSQLHGLSPRFPKTTSSWSPSFFPVPGWHNLPRQTCS